MRYVLRLRNHTIYHGNAVRSKAFQRNPTLLLPPLFMRQLLLMRLYRLHPRHLLHLLAVGMPILVPHFSEDTLRTDARRVVLVFEPFSSTSPSQRSPGTKDAPQEERPASFESDTKRATRSREAVCQHDLSLVAVRWRCACCLPLPFPTSVTVTAAARTALATSDAEAANTALDVLRR